jgi:hypothetical protein
MFTDVSAEYTAFIFRGCSGVSRNQEAYGKKIQQNVGFKSFIIEYSFHMN